MKQTPNYNLNKLEGPDTADLTQFNPNWDTLDTNLKQQSDDHDVHKNETVTDDAHGLKKFQDRGLISDVVPRYYGDLKDIAVNSIYNIDGGVANIPADFVVSRWGFVVTYMHVHTNGYATQIIYGMNSDNRYKQWMRHQEVGVWTSWKKIWTEGGEISAPVFRHRNSGTVQYIHDYFEHNGGSRWAFVTEGNADFAVYDYDGAGGSPRRAVRIDKNSADFVVKGSLYALDGSLYVYSRPGQNSHVWLKDEDGVNQGILFWDRYHGIIRLRRYHADGIKVEGELVIRKDRVQYNDQTMYHEGNSGPLYRGSGNPEGVVTAPVGAIYQRANGSTNTTLYVKELGTGNTGWEAK